MRKNSILHKLYMLCGHIFCRICLIWWRMRDLASRPKSKVILFVAHPDDDTLFFHSFIKEYKPYVVLLFTGWSLRRLSDFYKVMRHYGVRCRAYDTVSAKAYQDARRRTVVEKHVSECLKMASFELCATHNATGEYGHPSHRLVHESVAKVVDKRIPILCPVGQNEIEKFPLAKALFEEKKMIFQRFYTTEAWVLEQYSVWSRNEKLVPSQAME